MKRSVNVYVKLNSQMSYNQGGICCMLSIDAKASELIALLLIFIYAFFPLIPDIVKALKKKLKSG